MNIEFSLHIDPEKASPTHPDFKGRGTIDGIPFIGMGFRRKDPINKTPMIKLRLSGANNSRRFLGRLHLSSDGQCSGSIDTDEGAVHIAGVCDEKKASFNSINGGRNKGINEAESQEDVSSQQVRYSEDVVVKDVPGDVLLKLSTLAAENDTSVANIARKMLIDLAENMD